LFCVEHSAGVYGADEFALTWKGNIISALKAITSQDLGREAAAWQQWWDARPVGATAPAPTAPPTPACTRNAVFQADVTIPDNTAVKAG
jgi:hypothetical protein